MSTRGKWARVLVIAGLVLMLLGAADPMEGSLVIVPAVGLAALGAWLSHSRYRTVLFWSLAMVAVGVGALWGLSSIGGMGGNTGRTMWWALLMLPYPIGWLGGIVFSLRKLREGFA